MLGGMNSPESGFAKLVIGIGNDYRGDDGAGLLAARRIAVLSPEGVEVIESTGDTAAVMDLWMGSDLVVAIDAVFSAEKPGKVYRFEPIKEPIPSALFSRSSTHDFGLMQAIELSRTLDSLPKRLIIYGIEGGSFEIGANISEEVVLAIEEVVPKIVGDLSD